MAVQNSDLFQVWALRLSLGTALFVALLSWINGVSLVVLIVRAGVSFVVMFFLTVGFLSLFERTASPKQAKAQTSPEDSRGGVIDFTVGDEEQQESPAQNMKLSGQIDQDLSAGLDSERQAEIVRRMGWESNHD